MEKASMIAASSVLAVQHELQPHLPDLENAMDVLRRDPYTTEYISSLIDQWACGNLQTVRVFTDQWPDCTCVVISKEFESPDDSKKRAHFYVTGNTKNVIKILQRPGVIKWNMNIKIVKGFEKNIAERILETVYNPFGRELGHMSVAVIVNHYKLFKPVIRMRNLPDGFYFKELDISHAEYIGEYWTFWKNMPKLRNEKFRDSISSGSVGIFTDSATPHRLVSWAIRSENCGGIHHLYTLEEYRGRGLASAVVREMSRRIQDKGQVPFCEIVVGNTASVALFNRLGFVKDNELYYRLNMIIDK